MQVRSDKWQFKFATVFHISMEDNKKIIQMMIQSVNALTENRCIVLFSLCVKAKDSVKKSYTIFITDVLSRNENIA